MAKRKIAVKEPVYNPNVGKMIIGLAVVSVGIFIMVSGFAFQLAVGLTGQSTFGLYATVLPLYFVGLVVIAVGKIIKCKAHNM